MNRIRSSNKFVYFDKPRIVTAKYVIKSLLYPLVDIFYNFLYSIIRTPQRKTKYDISICAIFRNESSSLKEWIEYHKLLGVKHFYLYNNFSNDDYEEILSPYIAQGVVTLINWEVERGQFSAYQNWYTTFREETQWVCFLDLDEFICPVEDNSIPDWLNKMKKYPVIQMYWLMFTSSGIIRHDFNKLNIEQYVVANDKLFDIGKVFYNTNFEIHNPSVGMMHGFLVKWYNFTLYPVNQWKHISWKGLSRFNKNIKIQVNHYWGRALDLYVIKKNRGSATGLFLKSFDNFMKMEYNAKIADYKIFKYIIPLKINLFGSLKNDIFS